jgi:hypothetical protein
VRLPLLQVSPFQAHWGKCAIPAFSGRHVYYSSHGKCPFSPLHWGFPHTDTFTSFPAPRLLGVCCHCCLLQLACSFTVLCGISSPPLFSPQGAPPSLLRVFCCCCCSFSLVFFSPFSLGGGQSVQGAMLIWPSIVCGGTMYRLAHLVVCFSRAGRRWRLAAWEPAWFLHVMWSGDALRGLEVWRNQRNQSFASS